MYPSVTFILKQEGVHFACLKSIDRLLFFIIHVRYLSRSTYVKTKVIKTMAKAMLLCILAAHSSVLLQRIHIGNPKTLINDF